jgi:nucleotide-binding universal stress UspA family protein
MSFATGLKTIVVAVDLNGRSGGAMEYARKLAVAYGARLVLVYSADPLEFAFIEGLPGSVVRTLSRETRDELDHMAAGLIREGIHSHSEVRQGLVADMMVASARQHNADLIVIGTEGRAGAGPLLVGSLAEEIVRRAVCPVMAVASDWNAGSSRPVPGGPVLLALQKDEAALAAVEAARSLAHVFERKLLVLHARSGLEASALLNPCVTTLKDFGLDGLQALKARCIVKDGNPADVVEQAIRQHHPSVLVVGVKRVSEKAGPHGTAFTLLARSRVPVLCVPPAAGNCEENVEQMSTTDVH